MPDSILKATADFVNWFKANGLEPPITIRLKDKETGIHFAQIVEKEVMLVGPKAKWKPDISYIEINGVRFVWPMPELG